MRKLLARTSLGVYRLGVYLFKPFWLLHLRLDPPDYSIEAKIERECDHETWMKFCTICGASLESYDGPPEGISTSGNNRTIRKTVDLTFAE